ncbi:MAG TPA: EAL domain-containing protein [Devosiaceae bacterium]|jgi:diguanylate cyclase (GGDEF)-like protein|nr:EAL domain-containing protein [Devosiaceae bacterium]
MIAQNLAVAIPEAGPNQVPEQKTRILVVDDVPDNRDILVRRLARRGFEAVEAESGAEALKLVGEQSFDIVLLDIMMPDMNGNDVLKAIRRTKSDVELPVIMVSAKSQSEDVVESLSLGANDYVTKPIDFTVALARIANQVTRKQAADAERARAEGLQHAIQVETDQRRHSEERLQYMAFHDPLTGLLNRSAFRDLLNQALDDLGVSDGKPAVLFVDLDRFKAVNDSYGHQTGDLLLKAVADRLRTVINPGAQLCRLGGDEFGALILGHDEPDFAMQQADAIVAALEEPFEIEERWLQIGASCGVAIASSEASELDVLVKAADLAMYHAKKSGRSNTVLFEPHMMVEQDERRALEEDLRAAVRRGEFQVFYQPLVDVQSGKVRSFEALVRWPHETRGLIAPDTFIPLAEETGLIINLGEWVLREACKQAMQWPEDITVAVNLSPLQFRNPSLIGSVVSALAASGLPPRRLELEITETALLGAEARNHEILRSLRNLGVRVSIDDFGTGYSSMSYLQNFSVDKIKIDKRFVQGLDNGKSSAAIIQAIVNLGVEIGVGTAAEGVETHEQLASVVERGCTLVQGYLFSRPLTADDANAFARAPRDAHGNPVE